MKLFLEFKECSEVIENDERPTSITEIEAKKKEIKAKNYIVNSMTNTQLELIISEETATKMIDKLNVRTRQTFIMTLRDWRTN